MIPHTHFNIPSRPILRDPRKRSRRRRKGGERVAVPAGRHMEAHQPQLLGGGQQSGGQRSPGQLLIGMEPESWGTEDPNRHTKSDRLTKGGCMFWLVWNPEKGYPTHMHETETVAREEAERLARKHPGFSFHLMAFVASVKTCTPPPPPTVPVEWRNDFVGVIR